MRHCTRLFLLFALAVPTISSALAQEQSVKPGINDSVTASTHPNRSQSTGFNRVVMK
jgi:hypothetical protein